MNKLKSFIRRFAADRKASTSIIMALSMVPLMGITGAAIDYSRAVKTGEHLQAALDSATLAGAIIARSNRSDLAEQSFYASLPSYMSNEITALSLKSEADPAIGSVFQAQASVTMPTAVMKIMGIHSVKITRKSEALFGTGDNSCVLTLGGELDLDDEALTFNGSPNINLNGCSVRSNKSIKCNGHSTGAIASIAAGNVVNCPNPIPAAGIVPDLYAGIAGNIENKCGALTGNVTWDDNAVPFGPNVVTVARTGYNEIHICGNLTLSGDGILAGTSNATDTVIVVENGNVQVASHADLQARRTTFVLAGEVADTKLNFPNGNGHSAKLAVSSSKTPQNPWAGIAIYQDPRMTGVTSMSWGPAATLIIDGINYLPRTDLTLSGNAQTGASQCSKLITYAFRINGAVSLQQDASGCTSQQVVQFNSRPRLLQ